MAVEHAWAAVAEVRKQRCARGRQPRNLVAAGQLVCFVVSVCQAWHVVKGRV